MIFSKLQIALSLVDLSVIPIMEPDSLTVKIQLSYNIILRNLERDISYLILISNRKII